MISARRLVSCSLLLLATLMMSGMATVAASAEPSSSPAPLPEAAGGAAAMSSPSPDPDASLPASPSGSAGPSPSAAAGYCVLFEAADVAGFLGAELISVTEVPALGNVLGGCEAVATNSVSLTLRVHDASGWEERIASFGNEPVPTLPDAYYSDIVGLSFFVPDSGAYLAVSLRPGFDVNDHIRALYLVLGR